MRPHVKLSYWVAMALAASSIQAAEKGAGTEGRQWLKADETPASLLPAMSSTRSVVELKEAAANLSYDSVTKVWGIPVPRRGDPDYAPNNLNYTGVVRDAPLTLPARVYVPDGKLDRSLPCILVTNGYGVGGATPAAAAPGAQAPPGGGEEGGGGNILNAFVAEGYIGVEVALRQASMEPQDRQIGINGYYRYYGEDGVAAINEMVRRLGCGMTNNNPDTAKVGMVGGSLVGGSQWAVVSRTDYPAALKAIAPDSPGINHMSYSTLWYPGGMLPGPQRMTRPGQEFGNNFPAHRDYDAFWSDLQISSGQLRAAASRKLALLLTAGWYEYNSPGNLDGYVAFNSLSGATNKRLVVSPTGHTMPNWLYRPLALDWMARYLKGETSRAAQPPVLIYVRGADQWRAEQSWPIADTKHVQLALSAKKSGTIASRNDGSLLPLSAAGAGSAAQFEYDPVKGPFLHVMVGGGGPGGPPGGAGGPGGAAGGPGAGGPPGAAGANASAPNAAGAAPRQAAGAANAGPPNPNTPGVYNTAWVSGNMAADDKNTVTWTSGALDKPMEITGNPSLKFWASSSIDDADFVASLTDVAPDGTSSLIIQGYLNGPREAYTREDPVMAPPVPLEPGVPRQFTLRLLPTSYVVPAGHRIRIAIAGGADLSATQRQAQGPGKNGKAFKVTILQSAEKGASLDLPVIGTPATALVSAATSKK